MRCSVLFFFETDPYKDPFEERDKERKERIAKNEYQRLRNIARAEKGGKLKGKVFFSVHFFQGEKLV